MVGQANASVESRSKSCNSRTDSRAHDNVWARCARSPTKKIKRVDRWLEGSNRAAGRRALAPTTLLSTSISVDGGATSCRCQVGGSMMDAGWMRFSLLVFSFCSRLRDIIFCLVCSHSLLVSLNSHCLFGLVWIAVLVGAVRPFFSFHLVAPSLRRS